MKINWFRFKLDFDCRIDAARGKYREFLLIFLFSLCVNNNIEARVLKEQMFTVTAYYSPLPHQSFYVTGDYDAEIRLNGRGIAGADGTKVFPGMIAAPSNYAFGTKICLKGLGCGAVHDRGGAIVKKGERNLAKHDRLDIWMGYGEAGLLRALNFNFKHLNGTVYSPDSNIASTIYFKDSMSLAQILEGLPERIEFRKNLSLGSNGNEVKKLQKYLVKLGLFKGSVNGIYDKKTVQAVLHFQQKYFVLKNSKQVGAGVFGPKTRNILTDILYKVEMQKLMQEKWNETHFEKSLNKGKRSADVYKLQEILIKEELLEHVPTGYFGSLTKQALIAWQIKKGIVRNKYQNGAGLVGPKTRDFLNDYVQNQRESIKKEHGKILVFEKRNQKLNYLAGKNLNLNFVVR